jgi:FdhD protein
MDDIVDVRICQNLDNVDVWTRKSIERPVKWRHTSGCTGGVTSVEFDQQDSAATPVNSNGLVLTPRKIVSLVAELFKSQELYKQAGGVHTSAITDGSATFLIAEDIGRHNTLDKIAGQCLIKGININPRILITTGRISSEMLQKAARLQAFFLISRTSPTSLSISLADRRGITLIGYARRDRFKVYSHAERIINLPEQSRIPSHSDESHSHEPQEPEI